MWSLDLAKVDPFVVKWPNKWVRDPEIGPVIRDLNRFLHNLWQRTGGGEDAVSDAAAFNNSSLAQLNAIREQIGSGDFLTSDETGFTVDLETLTVDMDEA